MDTASPVTAPPLPDPVLVDLDGVRTATWMLGPEGAAPLGDLVICHGTPWSAELWGPLARALSVRWRVHLWDMPGYGRSAMEASPPLDLATQGERFARLLEHWGLDRPRVLAHDIGGAVALGAHLRHGSEFAALMLWDPVLLEPWGSPFFRLVAEHADVFTALPSPLHAALVREYVRGAAHRDLLPAQLTQLLAPWSTPEGRAGFYRQIAALRSEHTRPLTEALDRVRCPVALGWGAQDPWIPLEQAARLRALLPAEPPLTVLPGVGHLAPYEAPDALRRSVEDWLEGAGTV